MRVALGGGSQVIWKAAGRPSLLGAFRWSQACLGFGGICGVVMALSIMRCRWRYLVGTFMSRGE